MRSYSCVRTLIAASALRKERFHFNFNIGFVYLHISLVASFQFPFAYTLTLHTYPSFGSFRGISPVICIPSFVYCFPIHLFSRFHLPIVLFFLIFSRAVLLVLSMSFTLFAAPASDKLFSPLFFGFGWWPAFSQEGQKGSEKETSIYKFTLDFRLCGDVI